MTFTIKELWDTRVDELLSAPGTKLTKEGFKKVHDGRYKATHVHTKTPPTHIQGKVNAIVCVQACLVLSSNSRK